MKKKKLTGISNCCSRAIRIQGVDDFDNQCTMYYACTYCNKPCDVIIPIRKTWAISPVEKVVPNKKKKKSTKLSQKEIKKILLSEDF